MAFSKEKQEKLERVVKETVKFLAQATVREKLSLGETWAVLLLVVVDVARSIYKLGMWTGLYMDLLKETTVAVGKRIEEADQQALDKEPATTH